MRLNQTLLEPLMGSIDAHYEVGTCRLCHTRKRVCKFLDSSHFCSSEAPKKHVLFLKLFHLIRSNCIRFNIVNLRNKSLQTPVLRCNLRSLPYIEKVNLRLEKLPHPTEQIPLLHTLKSGGGGGSCFFPPFSPPEWQAPIASLKTRCIYYRSLLQLSSSFPWPLGGSAPICGRMLFTARSCCEFWWRSCRGGGGDLSSLCLTVSWSRPPPIHTGCSSCSGTSATRTNTPTEGAIRSQTRCARSRATGLETPWLSSWGMSPPSYSPGWPWLSSVLRCLCSITTSAPSLCCTASTAARPTCW